MKNYNNENQEELTNISKILPMEIKKKLKYENAE